jgi:diguanylate cyclase (GGDEF)-like protein
MVSAKTLDAINRFRSMLKDDKVSFDQILSAAFDTIKEILGFENIGFCNYSSQTNCWKVQALQGSEKFVRSLNNVKIQPHKALISKTLFQNETLFLAPIDNHKNIITEDEPFNSEGYFVSVPLQSLNSSYGAIFVFGEQFQNLTHYDAKILGILSEQIASTIEKYLYINVFQSYSQVDPLTGILNPNAFYQRLNEEISRALDYRTNLAFLTLQVDDYEAYNDYPGLEDSIQRLVIDKTKSRIRKYDLLGHIDDSILGLIILNMSPNDIRIWSDQLRKEIANKFITFDDQRFMVTVSMGIACLTENESIDSLTSKTLEMLKSSVSKKNTISIY